MKKLTKALILLLSVVFLFTSCEGSLSSTLSKMMDPFAKNNLYLNSGLVKPNLGDAEELNDIATNTKPVVVQADETGKLDLTNSGSTVLANVGEALSKVDAGIVISTDSDNENIKNIADALTNGGILDAQDQSKLLTTVNNALNSPTQTEQFKKNMSEAAPAETKKATQNTYAVGAAVINIVTEQLKSQDADNPIVSALGDLSAQIAEKANSDNLTKGDVLQAQIITNLINTSAKVAVDVKDDPNVSLENKDMKELVDGAILLINTSKTISGGLDLSGIDFGSIIPSESKIASRSVKSVAKSSDYLATNPFGEGYVNLHDFGVEGAEDKLVSVNSTEYELKIKNVDINNGILLSGYIDRENNIEDEAKTLEQGLALYKSLLNIYFTNGDGVFNGNLLAEKNQNFAFMLSGYKLLYSVADNPGVKEYIEKANKAEISVVLDSAIGLLASEIPLISKAYLGSANGYVDYISAMYDNSGDFFSKDSKIVVNNTDESSCSKISIGQSAIKKLYEEGRMPIDVVLIDKNTQTEYHGSMWHSETEFDIKTVFTDDTQTRFLSHADFLDKLIVQMDLNSLVYDKLEFNETKADDIRHLLELVFEDMNKADGE